MPAADGGTHPVKTVGGCTLQAKMDGDKIVLGDERGRTATVTIAVALAASGLRGGLLLSLAGQGRGQRLIPALELTAGVLVVLVAGGLLMSSL